MSIKKTKRGIAELIKTVTDEFTRYATPIK